MRMKREGVVIDKIYFRIENYSPKEILGISLVHLNSIVDKSTGEVCDRYLYKLLGFKLVYDKVNNSTAVNVNLRKFFYGKDSLKDFDDKESLKVSLVQLSELLKISYETLVKSHIYSMEIGKNFSLNYDCSKVVNCIKNYSTFKAKRIEKYVNFEGTVCDLKIYDKLDEICSGKSIIEKTKFKKSHENENYLRIEFKLKKNCAIKDKLYGYVETLGDLLAFFDFLPYILTHEIKRLEFFEDQLDIVTGFEGNTIKDLDRYLIALGIQNFGIENTINEAKKLAGMDGSYHHRAKYKKIAAIVKIKNSKVNFPLMESFIKQLNVSEKHLDNLQLASNDFCYEK